MELKNYTLSQLGEFIKSGEYLSYNVVPISSLRVFSQQKNPKAKPDDIVLSIAFSEQNEILGFVGALPDEVNGIRCAWNSCWWVQKGVPAEISLKLLFTFISNWNKKVVFSEMTPLTSTIIGKLNFCTSKTTIGFRGYYRFSLKDVVIRKIPQFARFKILLQFADAFLNLLIGFKDVFKQNSFRTWLEVKEISELTSDDDDFILNFNNDNPSKRNAADFNWIIQNSWLDTSNKAESKVIDFYPFSYAVRRFESKWIRFYHNDELVGLVYCTIKNNELKLPYVFCRLEWVHEVTNFFYDMIKNDVKLSTISTFHQGIAKLMNARKRFIFKTSLPKFSAISNELHFDNPNSKLEFQMGDGDCVFT